MVRKGPEAGILLLKLPSMSCLRTVQLEIWISSTCCHSSLYGVLKVRNRSSALIVNLGLHLTGLESRPVSRNHLTALPIVIWCTPKILATSLCEHPCCNKNLALQASVLVRRCTSILVVNTHKTAIFNNITRVFQYSTNLNESLEEKVMQTIN